MKDAIFHLANLNLTVMISPDARRWVQEHIVSLETYAWAQAQRRLNGLPLDKGVSVVLDCEDDRRGGPMGASVSADAVGSSPTPANQPGDTYHTKKTEKIVREIARGEEWPKWERNDEGLWGICRSDGPTGGMCFGNYGKSCPVMGGGCYQDTISKQSGWKPCTEADAIAWLRANGHADAAAQLERKGARCYTRNSGAEKGVLIGTVRFVHSRYGWTKVDGPHTDADMQMFGHTELHGAERESILADPALLALVGG